MMNTTIMISGSAGWLGHRLVRAVVEGIPGVRRLERPSPRRILCLVAPGEDLSLLRPFMSRIEIFEGDLSTQHSLLPFFENARAATLFNCAGVIHPSGGIRQFDQVNVIGVGNLVRLAARFGVAKMIHMSSNSPFGINSTGSGSFDESSSYNPYMAYGKSKMLGEQEVLRSATHANFEATVIRAPWFYGPGQPDRQTVFFRMIRNGTVPVVGSGKNRRSMAYVDDVCQALLLAEAIDSSGGEVVWISDSRPYTMVEIIETIEHTMKADFGMQVSGKRLRLPSFVSEIAYLTDGLIQSLGLYNQRVHVLSEMNKNIHCCIDKAQKLLGYSPSVTLREGMRRSIQDLLDRGIEL